MKTFVKILLVLFISLSSYLYGKYDQSIITYQNSSASRYINVYGIPESYESQRKLDYIIYNDSIIKQ